ncbi:MAG: hypothetical protein A3F10_00915 [Coxiella sp. RIFCSPHIGHO2_12_FULL_42_15]|nr:MAG: hypothetical protein A3F10_00915 [Coxiella sp. RIFCSPHIGHO2_12_FULL_42_15]
MNKVLGLTLMELLIALLIIGILVGIAVPTYQTYVLRGNRADAFQTLLGIQLQQEKYRLSNTSYGTLAQVWGGVTTSPRGHYTLSITNLSATSYTITATAVGSQTADSNGGTSCATMTLSYSNGTTTKTPAACWGE